LDEPSVPAGGILPCRREFRLVPWMIGIPFSQ